MKKLLILAFVFIMASQTFADLRQANYRWRLDNAAPGNENWAAATNTAITITPGQQVRLRLGIENEETDGGGYCIDLYYSTAKDTNGTWTAVANAAGAHFNIALTDYFTEADVMNNEPNFPNENPFAGGTFIEADPNRLYEYSAQSSHELEYSIIATANANLNTTYYFIIKPNGGVLNDWRPWDGIEEWATLTVKNTVSVPTVTTAAASSVGTGSATLGGNVTSAGGLTVLDRGVVYSTTDDTDPEVWESGITKDGNGSGTGAFSESIGSLSMSTTYYYRAYATNSAGTGYGDVENFTTDGVSITFTNGANAALDFQQTPASNPLPNANWLCGQFSLAGDVTGATLNSVTVTINGTYDPGDLSSNPFQLYAASSNNFGSSSPLGSSMADPGSGGDVTFTGLSDDIPASTRYYWVTADISENAEYDDTMNGTIDAAGDLSITSGTLSGSSSYGKLNAGSDASLPVTLSMFSAIQQGTVVLLQWRTESEFDHLGFILERQQSGENEWIKIADYLSDLSLAGEGNNSTGREYSVTDETVEEGVYTYRLIEVSMDGEEEEVSRLSFTVDGKPELTQLKPAVPNPFNPQTQIFYELAKDSRVTINIYDVMGRPVKTLLFGKNQSAGSYNLYWNGDDEQGVTVSTGTYFVILDTGEYRKVQKVMMLR